MINNLPFSVAMCVYGGDDPEHFKAAVESILNQTVKPDEVVLVVDGPVSPFLNANICEFEKFSHFRVIRLKENQGHGVARRIGLQNCSYETVALMDADDISVPTRFEKELAVLMDDPSVAIVGSDISEFIGSEQNIVACRRVPSSDKEIKSFLKKRCPMNQMTVMFRKSQVESVGGYLDWYCEEDYYLWIRMCLAGMKFANIPEILVNVRVGEEMYQRRGGLKYFSSERRLQKYMLKHKIINLPTYIINVGKRLVVQVLLPNRLRGWVFRKFARN